MKRYGFGVDIGGTTCKIGLFDMSGVIVEKWEIPTNTENNGAAILDDVAAAVLGKMEEKQIAKDDVQVFPSEEYAQGHRKQGAATGIYTPQELMKMDWLDECVEGEMPRYEALDVKSRFLLGVNGLDRYKDEPR